MEQTCALDHCGWRKIKKTPKTRRIFLASRKKTQTDNTITKIKDDTGKEYTKTIDILDTLIKFYKKLYSSNNIDDDKVQEYLIIIKCEKITNNEKKMCDELPTLQEYKLAIENMKIENKWNTNSVLKFSRMMLYTMKYTMNPY